MFVGVVVRCRCLLVFKVAVDWSVLLVVVVFVVCRCSLCGGRCWLLLLVVRCGMLLVVLVVCL